MTPFVPAQEEGNHSSNRRKASCRMTEQRMDRAKEFNGEYCSYISSGGAGETKGRGGGGSSDYAVSSVSPCRGDDESMEKRHRSVTQVHGRLPSPSADPHSCRAMACTTAARLLPPADTTPILWVLRYPSSGTGNTTAMVPYSRLTPSLESEMQKGTSEDWGHCIMLTLR